MLFEFWPGVRRTEMASKGFGIRPPMLRKTPLLLSSNCIPIGVGQSLVSRPHLRPPNRANGVGNRSQAHLDLNSVRKTVIQRTQGICTPSRSLVSTGAASAPGADIGSLRGETTGNVFLPAADDTTVRQRPKSPQQALVVNESSCEHGGCS